MFTAIVAGPGTLAGSLLTGAPWPAAGEPAAAPEAPSLRSRDGPGGVSRNRPRRRPSTAA